MNKLIIVIVITLFAVSTAYSQFYKGFGIKAGTSIANQTLSFQDNSTNIGQESDYNDAFKYKFGFTIGIFKEFHLIQNLKAQIGINYSRKGKLIELIETNEFGVLTGYKYYGHDNFDFFTAELYAKYDILNCKIRPYALAGLRLDFYYTQNRFSVYHDVQTDYEIKYPVDNNKIIGASLGAGLEYQTSKLFSVFIEGTYNPDFTYIINPGTENSFKYRGQSFDIRTGIKF
jgi:opacity protein-like surface antigen